MRKKWHSGNGELLQGQAHLFAGEHGRALIQKRFFEKKNKIWVEKFSTPLSV